MSLQRLSDLVMLGKTKTEVQDEIAQRIGLSFEQFTRAVLLAQNEFSAFLKTEENERGALLETLTGSTTDTPAQPDGFGRGHITCEDIGIGAADSVAPAGASAATTDMVNAALQQCLKYGKNPAGKSFSLTSPNGLKGRLKYTSDDGEDASELVNY